MGFELTPIALIAFAIGAFFGFRSAGRHIAKTNTGITSGGAVGMVIAFIGTLVGGIFMKMAGIGILVAAIFGGDVPAPTHKIIVDLRLPRTCEAIVVGAALGVAGALLQGALNNQLASPDIVGVTGGAGFGAVLILILFPSYVALLPICALLF